MSSGSQQCCLNGESLGSSLRKTWSCSHPSWGRFGPFYSAKRHLLIFLVWPGNALPFPGVWGSGVLDMAVLMSWMLVYTWVVIFAPDTPPLSEYLTLLVLFFSSVYSYVILGTISSLLWSPFPVSFSLTDESPGLLWSKNCHIEFLSFS